MASFIGTPEEFKRYIGPMLRNLVQQITKKYKKEIGKCEHCGALTSLESAHKHGRERGDLINQILEHYTHDDIITINLKDFEKSFREEHKDIEKTILILCRTCHTKYDALPRENIKNDRPEKSLTHINTLARKNIQDIKPIQRPFSNSEIQKKVRDACINISDDILKKMLTKEYSKNVFNLNYPLFKKIIASATLEEKKNVTKDDNGRNRWSLKYTFIRDGYLYITCSQWYPQQDSYIQKWFLKHNV